jgi:hypothetical protein
MCPVLFVDIEGGTFSIRDIYPNVDVVRIDINQGFRQVQAIYDEIESGKSPYKTVVLDSLTEMQKFSMYDIMIGVMKKDSERDPDIPSVREWGKNIEQIRRTVRGFRDLPVNTIFTALVSEDKHPLTGKVEKKPYLSGKLAHEVAGFLDIVLYYYVKFEGPKDSRQIKRLLLSQKTEDTVAKDRSDRLPMVLGVDGPITMQDLYGCVIGNKVSAQAGLNG